MSKFTDALINNNIKELNACYLDWVNNFLTITVFTEHYSESVSAALAVIEWGEVKRENIISEYNAL